MDILDVAKHDDVEEFRRMFTPDLYEQVRPNVDEDESAFGVLVAG